MARRFLPALAVAVVALVAALPATASPKAQTLTLAVNSDAFKIALTSGGKKVTSVKPGTYTFKLVDKSGIHNVDLLKGSATMKDTKGKAVKTSVSGKESKTVTVKLAKGTYAFHCDPHASTMKGTLKVA
jgi:plastocyanin